MEVKKKIEQTLELTPAQVEKVLKEHLKTKGFDVTRVNFIVGSVSSDWGGYSNYELTKVKVVTETEESQII